ncbi:peptidylprolyl isomerase [Phenylobacterium haematophilum]|uniref:peptidylprolyl isomerase n=1 Tax=Phenylobacterium haematophilum TaxID=98513 RepID=A0A839ZX55_9CAUL|nr:peptidylprolyl isomerase [Phenylobacterium haematophilum]MBB3889757.1 peptidylprolyl isomerase [Phenylobacterium haematophilum]
MIRTLSLTAAVLAMAAPAAAQAPAAKLPATAPAPSAADWRTPNPDDLLVIDTNKGRIIVEMLPEAAPAHVQRLRELTRAGFYDGRSFFRVIDDFMAQTGDPEDRGTGGSDKPDLTQEFQFRLGPDAGFVQAADQNVAQVGFIKSLPVKSQSPMLMAMTADGKVSAWPLFCPGVAAMARGQGEDSANSQFFLMRQTYPSLERRYTGWGRVVAGLDVVRAIKVGEPVAPPQDKMDKVRILADIPASERPKVRVIDPSSAWFKAEIESVRARMGENFSVCEIKVPSEVK